MLQDQNQFSKLKEKMELFQQKKKCKKIQKQMLQDQSYSESDDSELQLNESDHTSFCSDQSYYEKNQPLYLISLS